MGACVRADCRSDAECAGDALCVGILNPSSPWGRGSRFNNGFHCQTPADECYAAEPCPNPSFEVDCCPERACHYRDDRFVCSYEEMCNLC